MLDKNGIARRIAQELRDGWYVNLGIGIPTLEANHIPQGISVEFQSENGILGMGPALEAEVDVDLTRASRPSRPCPALRLLLLCDPQPARPARSAWVSRRRHR